MEGYRKILIIAEWNEDIDIVNDFVDWSLKIWSDNAVKIGSMMTLIETTHTVEYIQETLNYLTELKVLDVTDGKVYDKLSDYPDCVSINVINAIKTLDISDDIDYFLELINERGELDLLTIKETARLQELAKNTIAR